MKFDFALILTSLTLIAGLVWLIDHLIFARPRAVLQREGEEIAEPVIVDWSRSLFPVLLFVLVLRSFFFEPFRIPSSSMMPTLHVGDFILVNKFAYGVRLPVVNKKIFETGAPERGDVVVFRYPGESADDPDAGVDYIKRIIGLPGDLIQVADNKVSINGKPVNYRLNGVYVGAGPGRSYTGMKKLSELLFDGPEHAILSASDGLYSSRSNGTWQVPQGM